MKRFIVSACLAGISCSHTNTHKLCNPVKKLTESGAAVVVCPEVLGGLTTPREQSEIYGGDGADVLSGKAHVITRSEQDVTKYFIKGARAALRIATRHNAEIAILKSNSPSCGYGTIYDGSFSKRRKPGCGVTATLLSKQGLTIMTEKEFKGAACP